MTFDKTIEKIMPDIESGSEEPFIIYRDSHGNWQSDYTKNALGITFDWVDNVKKQDPLALEYTGKNFSNGSYATVYDDVVCHRLREEYDLARRYGEEAGNYRAITSFFEDHASSFSQGVMTYLTSIDRPLAALQEMIPYNMTTGSADWFYNEDLSDVALSHIENAVQERLHLNIDTPSTSEHDAEIKMNNSVPNKRVIEGYEEKLSIQFAGRAVVLAENLTVDNAFLVCNIKWDNFLGMEERYDGVVTDNYVEAMREFVNRVDELVTILETEREESGLPVQILTFDECIQGSSSTDWDDCLIIIKPESLAPEYRTAEHQLVLCIGGSGARAEARGRAVYVEELYSGNKCRYNRHQVAGIADLSKIPEWAKAKFAALQEIKTTPGVFAFGGYHFVPYRQFAKGETKRKLKGDSRPWKMDSQYEMRNMSSDRGLGLSKYDWSKSDYSHEKFYTVSGSSECDIFRCIENGKLYVPAENELFQYNEPPEYVKTTVQKPSTAQTKEKKPTLQMKLDDAKAKAAQESGAHNATQHIKKPKQNGRE